MNRHQQRRRMLLKQLKRPDDRIVQNLHPVPLTDNCSSHYLYICIGTKRKCNLINQIDSINFLFVIYLIEKSKELC